MAIVHTEPVEATSLSFELNDQEVEAFEAECPVCNTLATGIVIRADQNETKLKFDWSEQGQEDGCDHLYADQTWSRDDFRGSCQIYFGGIVDREPDDPRFDLQIFRWLGSDRYYLRHWL